MWVLFVLLAGSAAAADPAEPLAEAAAGRPALVSFWASWCGPCRTELPRLEALQGRLDTDRVTVLAVNIDRSERAGRAMQQKLGLTLPVIWDPKGAIAARFDPPALPATYLVSTDGTVVESWLGELDDAGVLEAEAKLAALLVGP